MREQMSLPLMPPKGRQDEAVVEIGALPRLPPAGRSDLELVEEEPKSSVRVRFRGAYFYVHPASQLSIEVERSISFQRKGFEKTFTYQKGKWDGYTSLFKRVRGEDTLEVPIGMYPQFAAGCDLHGVSVVVDNSRMRPMSVVPPNLEWWRLQGKDGEIELYDYQLDTVGHTTYDEDVYKLSPEKAEELSSGLGLLTRYRVNGCGIWRSATGSGKTTAVAGLIQKLGVRVVFVVYGTELVEQTAERFKQMLAPWLERHGLDVEDAIRVCNKKSTEFGLITVAGSSLLAAALNRPEAVKREAGRLSSAAMDLLDPALFRSDEEKEAIEKMRDFVSKWFRVCRKESYDKAIRDFGDDWKGLSEDVLDEPFRLVGGTFLMRQSSGDLTEETQTEFYERLSKVFLSMHTLPRRAKKALSRRDQVASGLQRAGLLIGDEVHLAGGKGYHEVLMACPAYYRVGMSGTPLERTDGQNIRVIAGFGEILSHVSNKDMQEADVVPNVNINFVSTKGGPSIKLSKGWLWNDVVDLGISGYSLRNDIISFLVHRAYLANKQSLVLFRSRVHGENLSVFLDVWGVPHTKLDGRSPMEDRLAALDRFRSGTELALVASDIFGTGIDIPDGFDLLINAGGGKGRSKDDDRGGIKILQRLGRGLRGDSDHTLEFWDFYDDHLWRLAQHGESRFKLYEEQDCFTMQDVSWRDLLPPEVIARYEPEGSLL